MTEKKVTLLDGAVGTSIWEKTEDKLPVWMYNIQNPAVVSELAHEYIDAGSKIILANTFGANGPAVKRSSDYTVKEVVSAGVRIAKEAVKGNDAYRSNGREALWCACFLHDDLREGRQDDDG